LSFHNTQVHMIGKLFHRARHRAWVPRRRGLQAPWYQSGVHRRVVGLAMLVCVSACGSPPNPPPQSAVTAPREVDPANVIRVRSVLPQGYEVAELNGPASAAGLWGFGTGWTADPAQCARLADPAPSDPGARGLSASGSGGTVFVVASAMTDDAAGFDLPTQCDRWTMTFVHTSAEVTRIEAPVIEGAVTVAWRAATRTIVEAGSETNALATAAFAYFDHHVAYVTLITDPGSPHPPLDPGFVADTLATTVAALRG